MLQGIREILASQGAQVVLEGQEQKAAWEKWEYQVGSNVSYLSYQIFVLQLVLGDSHERFPNFFQNQD